MARYNHFAPMKYKQILFSSLSIGDKFREDFFKGKRRRSNIICIKTGELSFTEERSKKERTLFHSNFEVSSYNELAEQVKEKIDEAARKANWKLCPEKINGSCPHHNLHCGYPNCEKIIK